MAKKASNSSTVSQPGDTSLVPADTNPRLPKAEKRSPRLWVWFAILPALGLIVVAVVSLIALNWIRTVKVPTNTAPTPVPVTTLKVERSGMYAGLNMTVVNAQYATSFSDDTINPGKGIVRLNMNVANNTQDQINVVYYDIARLLIPNHDPVAPTNVHLSTGPNPGSSEIGWLDFAIDKAVPLDTVKLQLGSTTLNESLVTLPFTGPFDPTSFANKTSKQSLTITYYFPYNNPHVLYYHLVSVDVRYDDKGVQAKAGQQFYVVNFRVDNPNGIDVNPGYGYDYIRMILGGNERPPVDNGMPYGFKASSQGTHGSVTFAAPAGIKHFTIKFRVQYGNGGDTYDIDL